MNIAEWRTWLGRLFLTLAMACGLIGGVIGIVEREWRLGVTGWFTGGSLLALLAIVMLADEHFERRRRQQSS